MILQVRVVCVWVCGCILIVIFYFLLNTMKFLFSIFVLSFYSYIQTKLCKYRIVYFQSTIYMQHIWYYLGYWFLIFNFYSLIFGAVQNCSLKCWNVNKYISYLLYFSLICSSLKITLKFHPYNLMCTFYKHKIHNNINSLLTVHLIV